MHQARHLLESKCQVIMFRSFGERMSPYIWRELRPNVSELLNNNRALAAAVVEFYWQLLGRPLRTIWEYDLRVKLAAAIADNFDSVEAQARCITYLEEKVTPLYGTKPGWLYGVKPGRA